ncbi:MAG: hypothetical protein WCV79_03390 [Candidatus Paceibacterota bacterium]|jgi:hypothetical protein
MKILKKILAIIVIVSVVGFVYLMYISSTTPGMGSLGLVVPGVLVMVVGLISLATLVLVSVIFRGR